MQKLEQLYEGKAKKVFKTDDPELYIVDYKDDATAFNGLKKGTIAGKGVINNQMTNYLMQQLEKAGVAPVSTLPLRRALAADLARAVMAGRNLSGGSARLAVAGDQLSGELVRTVTELALGNRYVLLDVPYGGDTLANQLRREYGVSLLLSPTRQQLEEADVLVLFAARTDLRRRDPAVLRLYDEAAPLPPLLLPPVLEGQMPPGLCRPQLLTVLVESGVLRPGQITVGTAES